MTLKRNDRYAHAIKTVQDLPYECRQVSSYGNREYYAFEVMRPEKPVVRLEFYAHHTKLFMHSLCLFDTERSRGVATESKIELFVKSGDESAALERLYQALAMFTDGECS